PEFKKAEEDVTNRIDRLMNTKGEKTVDSIHRELGLLMWDKCGMARDADGLKEALEKIPSIREEFKENVRIPGNSKNINMELEKAGRVEDFIDFAQCMCQDALNREESCGGHFRTEYQFTEDDPDVKSGYTNPGEAMRRDDEFCYVAAWENKGQDKDFELHKEDLAFENVKLSVRSYK
ncbi:MAG: fumarate reductase/succinate dehydrogenase flavoprotein subunit, partial [Verrucomicrobiota bacterium]